MSDDTDEEFKKREAVVAELMRAVRPILQRAGVHMLGVTVAWMGGPTDSMTFVASVQDGTPPEHIVQFMCALPALTQSYYERCVLQQDPDVRVLHPCDSKPGSEN